MKKVLFVCLLISKIGYSQEISTDFKEKHELYVKRALSEIKDENFAPAVHDFTTAFSYWPENPVNANYFFLRGSCKWYLQDFVGSFTDFKKALSISDAIWLSGQKAACLHFLAGSYFRIQQKDSACFYWSQAGELGYEDSYKMIKEYCQ